MVYPRQCQIVRSAFCSFQDLKNPTTVNQYRVFQNLLSIQTVLLLLRFDPGNDSFTRRSRLTLRFFLFWKENRSHHFQSLCTKILLSILSIMKFSKNDKNSHCKAVFTVAEIGWYSSSPIRER